MSTKRMSGLLGLILVSSALASAALTTSSRSSSAPASSATIAAAPTPRLERIHVEIPRQSFEVYAHLASEIVHARVLDTSVDVPKVGLALTSVHVKVLGAMKGLADSELTFQVAGGASSERIVEVQGAPRFTAGDEVVLFLWKEPTTGQFGLLGLDQGTYRVAPDAEGVRRVVGLHARGETVDAFFDRVGSELAQPAPWTR